MNAAKAAAYNLPIGIVFPSKGSVLTDNPSVLSLLKTKTLDAGFFLPASHTATYQAAFSNIISRAGFGFSLLKRRNSSFLTGGLGYDFGSLSLGLNSRITLDNFDSKFDLGMVFSGKSHAQFGIVLHDVTDFSKVWDLGIGFESSDSLKVEADFLIMHESSSLAFRTVKFRPGLAFTIIKQLNLSGRYVIDLIPSMQTSNDPELGLAFLFTDNFEMYGIMNPEGADYLIGLRIMD